MSTNEQNKTEEINQNGTQKLQLENSSENQLSNSVISEKNSLEKCEGKEIVDLNFKGNEEFEKRENLLENSYQDTDSNKSDLTQSENNNNIVLSEELNTSSTELDHNFILNNSTEEMKMSRPSALKSRLPNKTTSRSALAGSKIPGELTGQPSLRCTKDDVKYWKNREQELLSKIAELESKVAHKDCKSRETIAESMQEKEENDVTVNTKAKENIKNKTHPNEKEISNKHKETTGETNLKNFKTSEEIVSHLKTQNEDLRNALAKMTSILRDKTTMCISQEKKIAALVNQVESLKEVVAITKDLLNIRNMEVQHLSNDITAMESKIDCERQRHNQMLIKMDEAVKLNSDLKKEYENQLKLFQHLRDSYEKKIVFLSRDNATGKKEGVGVEKGIINSSSDSQVQGLAL